MSHIVYFDLETGGIQPTHPVIQIAAIAIDEDTFQELGTFETKVAFDEAKADPEALKINYYKRAAWANAATPAQAVAKFSAFVKPFSSVVMMSQRTGKPYNVAKLAGYNALTFDLPRLRALYGESFFPCSYQVRDVMQRVLFYFDESGETPPENFKLTTVCTAMGIPTDGAHEALFDVRLTIAVAKTIRECIEFHI